MHMTEMRLSTAAMSEALDGVVIFLFLLLTLLLFLHQTQSLNIQIEDVQEDGIRRQAQLELGQSTAACLLDKMTESRQTVFLFQTQMLPSTHPSFFDLPFKGPFLLGLVSCGLIETVWRFLRA
jgi:hypothetical protein